MNKWKIFVNVSALLSAIVAVIAFVISLSDEVKERQALMVDAWRKTAIHKVLQTAKTNELSIQDILSKTRNLAWEDDSVEIKQGELTEDKIRLLLIEMIASGLVDQNPGDSYGLRIAMRTTSLADQQLGRDLQKGNAFRTALLDKLSKIPGRHSFEELFQTVAIPNGFDRIEYETAMKLLRTIGVIVIDEQNIVELKVTSN